MLPSLVIPHRYNYIGVFLALDCNLGCSYCINRFGVLTPARRLLSGKEWCTGLNRIISRDDLPISFQGGEPTLHPDFFDVVSGVKDELHIDLLTNLEFDISRFNTEIPPMRLQRDAPYASIRVSYHPEVMKIEELTTKVLLLLKAGYSVGVWGVLHPDTAEEILRAQRYCTDMGIDFRTKEYLGMHNGILHGNFRYPGACDGLVTRQVYCRTTELLIGPGGDIYRCHSDLYAARFPIGHILDPEFQIDSELKECQNYGLCNPCDVKLKTDRFQISGHTSVEIRMTDIIE